MAHAVEELGDEGVEDADPRSSSLPNGVELLLVGPLVVREAPSLPADSDSWVFDRASSTNFGGE
jgi:hypothetical protein